MGQTNKCQNLNTNTLPMIKLSISVLETISGLIYLGMRCTMGDQYLLLTRTGNMYRMAMAIKSIEAS